VTAKGSPAPRRMRFQREDAHCLPAWIAHTGVVWSNGWRRPAHRRSDSSISIRITPSSPASLPALALPSYRPTCSNTPCWQPSAASPVAGALSRQPHVLVVARGRERTVARVHRLVTHATKPGTSNKALASGPSCSVANFACRSTTSRGSATRAHLEGSWPRCPDFIHVGRLGRECIQRQRQSRRRCTAGL